MSKSKKQKYKAEDVIKDINDILGILNKFENTPLENLDVEEFGKEIDEVTKDLVKKYPDSLDSKK